MFGINRNILHSSWQASRREDEVRRLQEDTQQGQARETRLQQKVGVVAKIRL